MPNLELKNQEGVNKEVTIMANFDFGSPSFGDISKKAGLDCKDKFKIKENGPIDEKKLDCYL